MESKSKEAMVVKYEWLQDAIENEYTAEEWCDLAKMLIEYGNGNYDYVPVERINRKGAKNILDCIKYNNEGYAAIIEKRREAGKKGGAVRAKQILELSKQNQANALESQANALNSQANASIFKQTLQNAKQNEADTDTDTGTDTDTDSVTIEEESPIVVVNKDNNKTLLAQVPVKTQWVSLGFENNPQKAIGFEELDKLSPTDVAKEFDNDNLTYKSVLITAYKVFCNHTGTNNEKYSKSVAECDNELYWKNAVNCIYFTGADIASILKIGTTIDNAIKIFGKRQAMQSIQKIIENVCKEGKYKDKPIEEKTRILIGSIAKFEKDCKQ